MKPIMYHIGVLWVSFCMEGNMQQLLDNISCKNNIMLKDIITFRTGGPVKCVYEPSTIDEIKQVLQYCRLNNNKYFFLGNGRNVLFTDEG